MSQRPSTSNAHRNKVERKRQYDIDEEIQKLMCFLPQRHLEQKMSRNQILEELYNIAKERLTNVHSKPVVAVKKEPL